MGQILLGLDIGTASIKGVRLSKSFRGLRLLDSFERAVQRDKGDETPGSPLTAEQIETLKILISEGKIKGGDLVALSLPGDLLSTREITLPFSDLKKVQQITPYEVEGELPFDLESVSIDYMVLKDRQRTKTKKPGDTEPKQETHLLVSAAPNNTLEAYLAQLQTIGIDPAWIGINALSLYSFSKHFLDSEASKTTGTLIIDVGASRTVLCHTKKGALQWIRTIPLGGNFLTEGLVKALDLSWEIAEERKTAIDLNLADPSKEEAIEIEILETGIGQLVTEIEKSVRLLSHESSPDLSATDSDETEGKRKGFHLCGGGGGLKGLESLLSEILEMEPVAIEIEKRGLVTSVSEVDMLQPEYVSQVYAQAFGLALQESDGPPINFRQGEFAYGKESVERRHRFFTFSLVALFLIGLMGGDLYLRFQKEETRYKSIKKELRSIFTQTFPKIRNIVNEVEQTRVAIAELQKTRTFLGVGEPSPLTALKEISETISEKIKIDVFNIVIDGNTVRIQAQTDSFESVDRIRAGLVTAKHFKQVEMSDAKATANKAHIRFRIKITVR